jgi:hypothetical protein
MSKFIEHESFAEAFLGKHKGPGDDEDLNLAVAQVWALLAVARAVREVADAIKGTDAIKDKEKKQ